MHEVLFFANIRKQGQSQNQEICWNFDTVVTKKYYLFKMPGHEIIFSGVCQKSLYLRKFTDTKIFQFTVLNIKALDHLDYFNP